MNIKTSEERIDRVIKRKERKEYKTKREKEKEDKYTDLPSHFLNKIYR